MFTRWQLASMGFLLAASGPFAPLRSAAGQAASRPGETAREEEVSTWISKLGADDLEAREEARERILREGRSALAALEKAEREASDPEVRWNARLLAREIRRSRPADAGRFALRPFRFDEDDGSGDAFEEHFRDLERRFGEMRRWFDDSRAFPQLPDAADSHGTSVRIESNPGSVRVEITETKDGGTETNTYEAESWDDFRAKHPGVLEKYGIDAGGRGLSFRPADPFDRVWPTPGMPPAVAGDERLGVVVSPLGAEAARDAGVEEGVGLVVERVEAGSLGAAMGVKRGDTLLRIGDEPIRGAGTIREALRRIGDGETVAVEVLREGVGRTTLSAEKRARAKSPWRAIRRISRQV